MRGNYLLRVLVALIVAILIWEVLVTHLVMDEPEFNVFEKGIVPKIGSNTLNTKEGYAYLQHKNEFGTYHKIKGEKPIIVYQGDSFTYAEQVPADKNYVALLNDLVPEYEHINAGNFGTHLADYYYNYDSFQKYHPAKYFIQLRYSDFEDSFMKEHSIHFVYKDGLELEFGSSDQMVNFFRERPELFLIVNRINLLNLFKEKYLGKLMSFLASDVVTSDVAEEPVEKNLYIKEQLALLKAKYGNFVIIYVPKTPGVINDEIVLADEQEERIKKQIFNAANGLEIEVIDLQPSLISYYEKTLQMPFGFHNTRPGKGHLNEAGHIITARKVKKNLEAGK